MLVASYGGGVNSTAMLIEFARRGIMPDLVTFADPGGERPATYRYVRELFSPWLQKRGIILTIVSNGDRANAVDKSLEAECLRTRTLPSIAYGHRSCSEKWKKRPQQQEVRRHPKYQKRIASGGKIVSAIGIDAGEAHRAQWKADGNFVYWYPLVQWDIDRDECKSIILDAGLCLPPKSSCFFCPAMKKHEIIALKDNEPELYRRAVAIEENAETHTVKGLGRHWTWRQLGDSDDIQLRLLPDVTDDRMPCSCFD